MLARPLPKFRHSLKDLTVPLQRVESSILINGQLSSPVIWHFGYLHMLWSLIPGQLCLLALKTDECLEQVT